MPRESYNGGPEVLGTEQQSQHHRAMGESVCIFGGNRLTGIQGRPGRMGEMCAGDATAMKVDDFRDRV